MLMSSQRQLSQHTLPDMIADKLNNKQTLHNEVLIFLSSKGCSWDANEVESSGKSLVTAITDTLWTIGHHHRTQGHSIPTCFTVFVGDNCSELSKHRKREVGNMSGSVLKSLSSHLFHCLQGLYWDRPNLLLLKLDVKQLVKSLSVYGDYLEMSSKKVKLNHILAVPEHVISENLHFSFLPTSSAACTYLPKACITLFSS